MSASSGTTDSPVDDITFKGKPSDPQDVRLLAALLDAHRRLSALTPIPDVCRKLLKRADGEAGRARYVAWDCLHQLDDELLAAMTEGERAVRWCTLRAEAEEKLKGSWRGKAGDCLAKRVPENEPVPLHVLRELQAHVATAAQNQQHKLDLFHKRSLPWVTALLALAVASALAFSYCVYTTDRFTKEQLAPLLRWAQAILLGIPAGALGGILSTAFSLGRADLKAKIPDIRLSRLVTLTRPLLGATVAIPVLVFIEAGYVKFTGFENSLAILAFCFLVGFSERWFLGVMERFEAGKK